MRMLERFSRDLKALERELFNARGTDTIRNLMIRKRNIITLKHMMKPQIAVLRMMEIRMKERFTDEVEFYFENLEDKIDKIFSEIQLLQENIDSMEDALKSIFELETNTTIKYLTVFSAFMLPLTLATSFFGMNIEQ
jgi:magnesium transporter